MSKSTRPTDSVEVCLRVLREVKVDDHIDRHNVDTAREQVCADQASCLSTLEVVIDPVPVALLHAWVDEEAWVAQLWDLLGQQLNSLGWVAEDDRLINVELGEESVQAVQFLPLF